MAKFENRVRFNWGYHDAENAFRNKFPNYGFASHDDSPLHNLKSVEDLVDRHFDYEFAVGFRQGWIDCENGQHKDSSQEAWDACLAAGDVNP